MLLMGKVIELSNNKKAVVDREDYSLIKDYHWYYDHGYVRSSSFQKKTYLHRLLLDAKHGQQVDHINGNPLDNRKRNLRVCSDLQNKWNTGVRRKNNKSGFKGVSWHKPHQLWRATIVVDKKQISLGYYKEAKLAAVAYDSAAVKYFGEFANINGVKI